MQQQPLIVILGPTASGKTKLATHLAYELNGEVLSADSRQIYAGMDIGTGKDLNEYMVNGKQIPHHLINIRKAGENYNIADYQHDFDAAIKKIKANKTIPILCGGTGMYIDAILSGFQFTRVPVDEQLRKELHNKSGAELVSIFGNLPSAYTNLADTSTNKRLIRAIEIATYLQKHPFEFADLPKIEAKLFGLKIDRELRRERISNRLHERLKQGMIEEVQTLLDAGISSEKIIFYGLEYKLITQYLLHEFSYEEMVAKLEVAIHQFAKRQMTYFRKMERDGHQINWIDASIPLKEQLLQIKHT